MKKLPTHKSQRPDCFIGEFYQTKNYINNITIILYGDRW